MNNVFGNFFCATFNNFVGNLVGKFLDAQLGEIISHVPATVNEWYV